MMRSKHPTVLSNRLLKKTASCVLASFRPSTYPQRVRLGPSLAAALLDGPFEQPD